MATKKPKSAAQAPSRLEAAASTPFLDITKPFVAALGALIPEDPLLAARGQDLRLYEEVLRDGQVKATLQQRQLAVTSREFKVEPGGTAPIDVAAAEHLEAQLKRARFDQATVKMLYGVFYGYAVAELMWETGADGLWRIGEFRVRRQRRFGFGADGALLLRTRAAPYGEALPPAKFWVFSAGAEHDDEPYGRGLAYWLYWPVFFKRGGLRFWAKFLERFGAPTAKGTYPRATGEGDQNKLLQALRMLQEGAAIVMPEGMDATLLETARNTSDHKAFHETLDAEIAKIVLSVTMTTDDGASRAQGQVHFDVRQEVAKADADLLCESFNAGPARWLTEWNFPGAAIPRVYRDFAEPEDLGASAERDGKIMGLGFEPDEAYVRETYGPHWRRKMPLALEPGQDARRGMEGTTTPGDPNPRPLGPLNALNRPPDGPGAVPAAFSEGEAPDPIGEAVLEMLSDWETLTGAPLAQIEAEAAAAEDYDDFVGRLLRLAPQLDVAALNERLARAVFQARLLGETDPAAVPGDPEA
jgi:phage gp29-like protein